MHNNEEVLSAFKQDSYVSSLKSVEHSNINIKLIPPPRQEVLIATRRNHEVEPIVTQDIEEASSVKGYESNSPH